MNKEQYDTKEFRHLCKNIGEDISLILIDVPGEYVDGKDNTIFIDELKGFLK